MTSWIVASSVAILAVTLLRYIFKGKISLRLRYALWLLVAIRLLIPVNFGESLLSIQNLAIAMQEQSQAQGAIQVSEQYPADMDYAGFYDQVIEQYKSREFRAPEPNEGSGENSITEKIYVVCIAIWGVGAALFGAAFIATNCLFGVKIKKNREKIEVTYSSLPVYISKEVETPCLFGIIRTNIYVTKSVAETPVLLKHAVCHEMTHYKHVDQVWSFVRCVCLALHWYNPLVWWAASLSKKDAEFACDEATILRLGEEERTEYGKTLIRLTCERRQDILLATTTMISGKKNINERITLIAEKPHARKYALILVLVASIVIAGGTFTEAKAEPRDEVQIGIGRHLEDIDWDEVKEGISEEEREALEKYQAALEGGQIIWSDRKTSGGATVQRGTVIGQFTIEEYVNEKMESMELEIDGFTVESFLFSDVFQSGELNVCLLLRHVSKSWIILHEEDGIIYGIDMSALNFKGVQEDGVYYMAGGRGIQYYEKMTFAEGDCQREQIGIMANGKYQQMKQAKVSKEVAIYTLIEELW
ncbi:MAG: M56 family metallopeptidase [Roseburia sp.]|nr:M56 family metallopeptidase [Roseburia sp.]